MPQRRLILASSSPRRQRLLADLGLVFEVRIPRFEEDLSPGIIPSEAALRNAQGKARSVAATEPDALIIGADTVVDCEGRILGKPGSTEEALETIRFLSGKAHCVTTGLCVVDSASGAEESLREETRVFFRELRPEEIQAYVERVKPLDRAGAYSIEDLGSLLVRRIEGCYFNVVGLPVPRLIELLRGFGLPLFRSLD